MAFVVIFMVVLWLYYLNEAAKEAFSKNDDEVDDKNMKPKYRAIPTTIDGIRFKSKGEAGRYSQLKLLEKAKKIKYLTCHPAFVITIKNIKVCKVELDFSYLDTERMCFVYEDFKGCDNPLSKLKRKLVEASHNITVTLVRK